MTLTSVIDPALMENLEAQGRFPNTGTVRDFTVAMNTGDAVETWADLAGHVDLNCAVSALSADEIEKLIQTIGVCTHKARLTGYYSSIEAKMRFVSDGVTYEITGVDHDQHDTMTRLFMKVITL